MRDELVNAGTMPWSGMVYRQLLRNPPPAKGGFTNPEAFSLSGAAWYSPEEKYEKRKYPDFVDDGPLNQQVTGGWVALSQHYFLAAWVPQDFWQDVFLSHDRMASLLIGPLIGPLIAIVSFVCSVGNVPLAAVLWNGGISFGGVVSFLFADLIILPILDIYRRYYGWKTARLLAVVFYATMVLAGYLVELLFGLTGLTPTARHAIVAGAHFSWDYTTVLNIAFLLLTSVLAARFLRTGGPAMLRMMAAPAAANDRGHAHHDHDHHHH